MQTTTRHVLFWVVVYILWTYMKSQRIHYSTYLIINLVNIAIYIAAYYFLKHVQIPVWFSKGKYLKFSTSLLLTSVFLYLIWRINGEWWIDDMRQINYPYFVSGVDYLTQAVQFYSPAMALLAWDTFYERKEEQERMHHLEKEKLQTELKYLKAQLNPHFLFNTLNNLYSFVVQGSTKAPDMIMRLSGILDYVLYKSQKDRVTLLEEIGAIRDFIELEKIRYGDRLQVDYEQKGPLNKSISPLLLLSIVENAFKHGASGDIDTPKISISVIVDEEKIVFKVWNTKSDYKGELNDEYKEGIGLTNIKRQLNLVYPKQHELDIQDTDDSFSIKVELSCKT